MTTGSYDVPQGAASPAHGPARPRSSTAQSGSPSIGDPGSQSRGHAADEPQSCPPQAPPSPPGRAPGGGPGRRGVTQSDLRARSVPGGGPCRAAGQALEGDRAALHLRAHRTTHDARTALGGRPRGGPRAFVDGASALVLAGLEHYTVDRIRVSVPRGARIRHRGSTVDIRQTRRWDPGDLEPTGLPRSRVAVAAIRAALWARSDRQAALVLTMTVQQGLVTTQLLAEEMLRVRRDKRRGFLHGVLLDLLGGVRIARGARRRPGLPGARAAGTRLPGAPPHAGRHLLPRSALGPVVARRRGGRHPPPVGHPGGGRRAASELGCPRR